MFSMYHLRKELIITVYNTNYQLDYEYMLLYHMYICTLQNASEKTVLFAIGHDNAHISQGGGKQAQHDDISRQDKQFIIISQEIVLIEGNFS